MSFNGKFLSLFTVVVGVAAFAAGATAQNTTTPDANKDGVVKQDKLERKGFGDHKHGGQEGFRGMHGGGRGGMFGLRGINLTDAQKEQIHTIMESNKPDESTVQQMHTLMQARRDGTITAEQQEQLKTLRQQQRERGESIHQQIQAILTPEQLQQIEKQKQEMKERWEQRRQQREQNEQEPEKPTSN